MWQAAGLVRDYMDSHCPHVKLLNIHIPDEYVEHGNVEILRREVGIDAGTVIDKILTICENRQ